jgi:hypothetical protein
MKDIRAPLGQQIRLLCRSTLGGHTYSHPLQRTIGHDLSLAPQQSRPDGLLGTGLGKVLGLANL